MSRTAVVSQSHTSEDGDFLSSGSGTNGVDVAKLPSFGSEPASEGDPFFSEIGITGEGLMGVLSEA